MPSTAHSPAQRGCIGAIHRQRVLKRIKIREPPHWNVCRLHVALVKDQQEGQSRLVQDGTCLWAMHTYAIAIYTRKQGLLLQFVVYLQHVAHKGLRRGASRCVDDKQQHGGHVHCKRLGDDGATSRPGKHFNLTGRVDEEYAAMGGCAAWCTVPAPVATRMIKIFPVLPFSHQPDRIWW